MSLRCGTRTLLLALALCCGAAGSAQASVAQSRLLDVNWEFRLVPGSPEAEAHPAATQWRQARVPGSVHTDLMAAGAIPDPYVGEAEAGLQWIGLGEWEYRSTFTLDRATLARSHAELVFEGLDTFADVYLNDTPLLAADNFFRTWRADVSGRLRKVNTLRVVLHSPIRRLLPMVQAMPHKIAGNYPSPFGDEPRDAMTGNFARKPGYHYGWDWGPRYVTAGIWRPIRLLSWDAVRATDLRVRQLDLSDAAADLAVDWQVESNLAGDATLEVRVRDPDGESLAATRREVAIGPGHDTLSMPVQIRAPRRWWPNGYGEAALYAVEARLLRYGRTLATASRRIGLRTVELRRSVDTEGQGFAFVVNGTPIFAKGANVIPFDAFPARVTPAQQRRVLESARDAHMNMLRMWGGGYYESDAFYDMTDELGLLVWQDFMFGGGMPPAYDPAFRANVMAEARDNVRRLRHHPSIVLWCGNNEEETAWKDWGQGRSLTQAAPDFARQVWDGYVALFGHDLRDVVAEEGNGVPYWSSSPSNDLDAKANDSDRGDRHYWDVWAGSKPVAAYLEETPRFMSEYGLQSWPSLQTIGKFAPEREWGIDTPVIRAHQKFLAGEGNARLSLYIDSEYGKPRTFADFVYLSQLMQADGIELAALHHRASRPRTMGSLYWQLNDVWPGASWSGIDHFGRWKALHYRARHFLAPLAVAALRRNGATEVTLISDRTQPIDANLRLRVIGTDGELLQDSRRDVVLAPLAATRVDAMDDVTLLGAADPRRTMAVFDLAVEGDVVSRAIVYFAAAKDLQLERAPVHAALRRDGNAYRLELSSARFVRGLWIGFGEADAVPADNSVDLLPGEPVSIRVDSPLGLAELQRLLTLHSLIDVVR